MCLCFFLIFSEESSVADDVSDDINSADERQKSSDKITDQKVQYMFKSNAYTHYIVQILMRFVIGVNTVNYCRTSMA